MTTKQPLNQSQIEAKYKLHPKHVREIMEDVPPVMQMKYGRGFMRYYDEAVVKQKVSEWKAAREPKPEPTPVAAATEKTVQKDTELHNMVDCLALGVDTLLQKVDQLSAQNAVLLKAIEKLQPPKIEVGALDKFMDSLPSAEGNGAKPEPAPAPAKPRKPKVMVVGLPPAAVAAVCREFADLDITFHSAERAKKLSSMTARAYDRVFVMLDYLNWGLPVLGDDVKKVTIKGGMSSLKTALTQAFVELADA